MNMSIKRTVVVSLAGGLVCAAGLAGLATWRGAEPAAAVRSVGQPEGQPTPYEMKKMLAEQAELAPQHKLLLPMVGEWNAEMSFVMEPGGEPEVSTGSCTNTMILGGRFLKSEFKGDVAMFGVKMAFAGFGLMGYSKETGEFQSTWCDSMSTGIVMSTGKPGENPKVITLTGAMASAQGDIPAKWVYMIESDKKHVMQMWQGMPGSDEMVQIGTITYIKKG
jgi:hypothetical protein